MACPSESGTQSLCSCIRKLWKDVASHARSSSCSSDIVPSYHVWKKFYRAFQDTALEVAAHELKEIPNMEQIYRAYIPPSLGSEKIDDDQFEDAQSQVSRGGSFA
ncbi:CSC1-like protein ERD4 [Prunus yedoensis var. nudiflora]|uniref:CSC1-like protein ERD4 n=1 Tax=Prunus yedoensis var. nudiflora TaxID=2094558 RepID=A0A314XMT9_PRUYE|nr:CSC1-like protein ERD4 [Prunus yedoensis var. nudiflora]